MVFSRNKLAKGFTGVLYRFSTVRKMSVTDDITDWFLRNKILGCATVARQRTGHEWTASSSLHCTRSV